MSDAQLEKIKMERDALAKELDLYKSAIPGPKAAEKLIEVMANKTDPFNEPQNEWASANSSGGQGCCTIM